MTCCYPTVFIVLASCAPVCKEVQEIPDWKQAVYYQHCESRPEEGYEPTGIMEIDKYREPIAHYYRTTWDLLFTYVEKIDNCPAYYTFEEMSINKKTAEEKEQIFRSLPPEDRQAILTFREKNAEIYDKIGKEAIYLLSEVTNTKKYFLDVRHNYRNLLNKRHNIRSDPFGTIIRVCNPLNHQRCALSVKQVDYTIKALQWIKIEHEIMSNFASQ